MENGGYLMVIVSVILSISSVTMLAACLCCRKKVQNNELLGLEGMVKIKNPDENLLNGNHTVSADPNPKSSTNDINTTDSKRPTNAPHRSLPDIPVSDPNQLDTNSDLYATVGDKVGEKPQDRSPTTSVKKQISVSQHSSISQADDCSSPYARVRSPSHAYDKVRLAEHPYAQLKVIADDPNRASASTTAAASSNISVSENGNANEGNSLSRRGSHQSLLDADDGRQHHQIIPAASAIAGRVSASQELPYMTPPIVQPQQYFSGDSQDSSKGYTSISVREPLANIIAQTKKQNAQVRRREITDSHYATVSDDSDEMYAAIDDPNNPVDLYTSGSETYAQIQPQTPLVVSVEINAAPSHSINTNSAVLTPPLPPPPTSHPNAGIIHHSSIQTHSLVSSVSSPRNSVIDEAPNSAVNSIAVHSRQASSSSCTSSVGNLGSPKPEKRQANSPLPPTPKNTIQYQSNTSLSNPSSLQSGRSSVASVIEVTGNSAAANPRHISRENLTNSLDASGRSLIRVGGGNIDKSDVPEDESRKNRLSKDLEGMYAKVMKKNKLSNAPSQNTSPVPYRKSMNETQNDQRQSVFLSDPDIAHDFNLPDALSKSIHASPGKNSIKSVQVNIDNDYETIDKRRTRSSTSNYDTKNDPGYETIPADKPNNANKRNNLSRVSAPPGIFVQKLSQQSLNSFPEVDSTFSVNYGGDSSEPGYESLPDQSSLLTNDPGYETVEQSITKNVLKKDGSDYDPNYEVLRPTSADNTSDHYAKVWSKSKLDANDGYSSIKTIKNKITNSEDDENPDYCTISNDASVPNIMRDTSGVSNPRTLHHDYASITEATKRFNRNDDEDVYTSITNEPLTKIANGSDQRKLQPSNEQHFSPVASSPTPSPATLSTNNALTSSMSSTISDLKTLTSPSSDSSSNTPINYNKIRSNTDFSQLTVSVSNYESLTGSESDSNYESVRYLNAKDRENPYEQLYNESDIKYDTLKRDETSCLYASSNENNSSFSKSSSGDGTGTSSKSDGKISTSSSMNLNNTDAMDTIASEKDGDFYQA